MEDRKENFYEVSIKERNQQNVLHRKNLQQINSRRFGITQKQPFKESSNVKDNIMQHTEHIVFLYNVRFLN